MAMGGAPEKIHATNVTCKGISETRRLLGPHFNILTLPRKASSRCPETDKLQKRSCEPAINRKTLRVWRWQGLQSAEQKGADEDGTPPCTVRTHGRLHLDSYPAAPDPPRPGHYLTTSPLPHNLSFLEFRSPGWVPSTPGDKKAH